MRSKVQSDPSTAFVDVGAIAEVEGKLLIGGAQEPLDLGALVPAVPLQLGSQGSGGHPESLGPHE